MSKKIIIVSGDFVTNTEHKEALLAITEKLGEENVQIVVSSDPTFKVHKAIIPDINLKPFELIQKSGKEKRREKRKQYRKK